MSTNNPTQAIKKMFLLFLGITIVGSSVVFSCAILGEVYSQLIASGISYYKTIIKQQAIAP